MENSFFVHL